MNEYTRKTGITLFGRKAACALMAIVTACLIVSVGHAGSAWAGQTEGSYDGSALARGIAAQAADDPTCALLKKDGNLYRCTSAGVEVDQYWDGNQTSSELFEGVTTLYVASDVSAFSGDIQYWERTTYTNSSYTNRWSASYYLSNVAKVVFLLNDNGRNACNVIDEDAFDNFEGLTAVVNFDKTSVASLGPRAFYGSSIGSIALPSTLQSIGDYAFYGCASLKTVSGLADTRLTSVGKNAFDGCLQLQSVALPSGCTSIGDYAFENCSNMTSVTFGSGLATIGSEAFRNCSKLTSVSLPAATRTLDYGVFYGCSQLSKVTMASPVVVSRSDSAYNDMSSVLQSTLVSVKGNNAYIYVPASLVTSYASADYSAPWYSYNTKFKAIPGTPKAKQPMSVKVSKKTVNASAVKKKAQSVSPLTVSKAQGSVSYKKASGSAKITVNSKTGKFTVKKGTGKGSYAIKVKVTAKGNVSYKSGSKTMTAKVVVK